MQSFCILTSTVYMLRAYMCVQDTLTATKTTLGPTKWTGDMIRVARRIVMWYCCCRRGLARGRHISTNAKQTGAQSNCRLSIAAC